MRGERYSTRKGQDATRMGPCGEHVHMSTRISYESGKDVSKHFHDLFSLFKAGILFGGTEVKKDNAMKDTAERG